MEWKAGDWCFFEFELAQVESVEDGRVTGVTTGSSTTCGRDLADRCVPLTVRNKNLSDHIRHYSKKLHTEGSPGLNYPDIHRWLVDKWVSACDSNDTWARQRCEDVRRFTDDILSAQGVATNYGFPLLRPR